MNSPGGTRGAGVLFALIDLVELLATIISAGSFRLTHGVQLMVVLNANDEYRLARRLVVEFQDQPKLLVEAHRALVLPFALELLVVERLEGVEIAFARRG